MISLIAALVLTPVSYNLDGKTVNYELGLGFDGFVPVLGGNIAKVDVTVGIVVKGQSPDADGNPKATSDVSSLKVVYNDAVLPFNEDNVRKYFPNTATFNPQGKVLKNDAPQIDLPIQLPGLDVKRFPDITFLAVEFPPEGIEVGKAFSYTRTFGSSEVAYTATPTVINDGEVDLDLHMSQAYNNQEDEAHNIVKDEKDAVASVATKVDGKGAVVFDRKIGLIRSVDLAATADSIVTDLKTKVETTRNLKTTLRVKLKAG